MRAAFASVFAVALLAGCGDAPEKKDASLSAADVSALEAAREKFLNYCGERKANGADETQPVPPPIADAVDDTIAILSDHRDASFDFRGESTTVEDFVREQEETLKNCSDQQQQRVTEALGG
jgi:hypothetical protein